MERLMVLVIASGVIALCSAGCKRGPDSAAAAPAPTFNISQPVKRLVTDFAEFTGRTNAKDSVSVQPRVTGYLVKMPFKEGAAVKAGDLLFEVDPRPYQAQYQAALAQVAQNQASLNYAHATNERFKTLAKKEKGAVSDRELDQYQALEEQAIANLDLAQANKVSAKLNLDWTKVTAPISGHISRYYLTIGNLVNQDVTQLTTVVSNNPMYAYFDMDEPTFIMIKRAINQGLITPTSRRRPAMPVVAASTVGLYSMPVVTTPLAVAFASVVETAGEDVPVFMGLQGEDGYPHQGAINFVDNVVNPNTASISVRGTFSNPKPPNGTELLVPGMFVRIQLPIGQPHDALLVIDRAITPDQDKKFVYVVDNQNIVQQRRVTIGALQADGLRVVTTGLEPTDWVVIGGLQQIRPNMKIATEKWPMLPPAGPAQKVSPAPAAKDKH